MKYNNPDCEAHELPGFKKKSFSMAFAGGEIWGEHLDGMYQYSDLVLKKLSEDSIIFCRPSMPSTIAIVLDETEVTNEIEDAIIAVLTGGKKRFTRIVFVGLSKKSQKQIKKKLLEHGFDFAFTFINNLEKAKEWLVSERY